MTTITTDQLGAVLEAQHGMTPVSFTSDTEPKLNKRDNPFYGHVRKVQTVHAMAAYDYHKRVERQSGEERVQHDAWYDIVRSHDTGAWTPLVKHKKSGELYLRVEVLDTKEAAYYNTETGERIERAQLEQWMPHREPRATDAENNIRCFGLATIRHIKVGGQEYDVAG